MAFWGVYVKPEEPYILKPDCDGRRLRITQATLGAQCGVQTSKTVLQCTVGNKDPISVCSLSVKGLSCCPLNLEFEECEDVVFSIVGPCGIYLAGCYLALCTSCRNFGGGANGYMVKYYDDREIDEEAENLRDKRLSTKEAETEKDKLFITEEAENENDKLSITEEAENVEDKNLSSIEAAGNEKDKDITAVEVAEKEKAKMLTSVEEDIEDTDSSVDGSLYGSEEDSYDLSDSFIDDCDLSVQASSQELLGVEVVNEMMVENSKPKKRISSSKQLKRNQSTESHGDTRSTKKQQASKNSSSRADAGAAYKLGSGGDNRWKQRQRTVKNSSSIVDGGADFNRGSDGTLGSGEKDKFNYLKLSGEPESGADANSDLKTHEHHCKNMKSQRKKRKVKENISDGMVIQELAKGKPNGKIATRGKKVKIMYTAWIKETGKIVESNSGQAPSKFQLGDEEIIKAWNVGVEGMRIGDKRRLILPPTMGSWRIDESTIPPNSCLVYDIELVGVH